MALQASPSDGAAACCMGEGKPETIWPGPQVVDRSVGMQVDDLRQHVDDIVMGIDAVELAGPDM